MASAASLQAMGYGWYQYYLLGTVGIFMIADGMEMFVMAIVLQQLPNSWALNSITRGLLGGAVFIGMSVGSPLFGNISDRIGRLQAFYISLGISLAFGVLSGLSINYWMLMLTRLIFGIGVGGGLPVANVLMVESSPSDSAGFGISLMMNLFAIGGCLECLFAVWILPAFGWSLMLVVSALPLSLPFLFSPCLGVVESPPWLYSQGRFEEAHAALGRIAQANGAAEKDLPSAEDLARSDGADSKRKGSGMGSSISRSSGGSGGGSDRKDSQREGGGGFFTFIQQGNGPRLTACLAACWFVVSFTYYGFVFALPTWFDRHIPASWEYWATFLTAVAEIPGNTLAGGKHSDCPLSRLRCWHAATPWELASAAVAWHAATLRIVLPSPWPHDAIDTHIGSRSFPPVPCLLRQRRLIG